MRNKLIRELTDVPELTFADRKHIARLFSDKVGIVNGVLQREELRSYGYVMFQSLSAKASILFGLSREVSSGGLGVHESPRRAFWACIGEAVERYCMSFCPKGEVVRAKKHGLPQHEVVIDHELYSNEQYGSSDHYSDPDAEMMDWVRLKEFKGRRALFWPASLVYLPYDGICAAETSSTGVAAARRVEDAVTSGLLELIERDALMINYLNRLNPPDVDLSTLHGNTKRLVEKMQKKFSIKLYRLYSDINVPIYSAVIWSCKGSKLHYGIGAAAALNSDTAIEKALKECLFTHFYSKSALHLKPSRPREITKLYEHFLYYQGDRFSKLLFISERIAYLPEKKSCEELLRDLKKMGLRVYYKELTTPDVAPSGIVVTKTIVPGLIDLNKSYTLRRLKAKRLKEVPEKLGLKARLTKMPHPFP